MQVRAFAGMICDVQEGLAPIQRACGEAAAIDPAAATSWRDAQSPIRAAIRRSKLDMTARLSTTPPNDPPAGPIESP
jgi:hypothetical protein